MTGMVARSIFLLGMWLPILQAAGERDPYAATKQIAVLREHFRERLRGTFLDKREPEFPAPVLDKLIDRQIEDFAERVLKKSAQMRDAADRVDKLARSLAQEPRSRLYQEIAISAANARELSRELKSELSFLLGPLENDLKVHAPSEEDSELVEEARLLSQEAGRFQKGMEGLLLGRHPVVTLEELKDQPLPHVLERVEKYASHLKEVAGKHAQ